MSVIVRVFVAGATGVLGHRAVRALIAGGHDVTAMARTPQRRELVESLGATAATVDLFDAPALRAAVAGHDTVCNLATHIPHLAKATLPGAWRENDHIRNIGSRNLVDAAVETAASRYVQESITFLYSDNGDLWIDEATPLAPVPYMRSALEAEAQAARFTAGGGTGVVLRFAQFYGPDSHHTRDSVRVARRHLAPTVGRPENYQSNIHTDDAAAAVVAAIEDKVPDGTYNVGDDEPLTRREFAATLAAALGLGDLHHVPSAVTRLGGRKVSALTRSQRISNAQFRGVTAWTPAYPSAREGLPAVVAALTAFD
jgi:nucleoside-diphosphate-sugar epimerase